MTDDLSECEVYVSACCNALFAPYGSHNIRAAEAGKRLLGDRFSEGDVGSAAETRRVYLVTPADEQRFDAVRAGECPACGTEFPGLTRLNGGKS